jgi:hypothetical protein
MTTIFTLTNDEELNDKINLDDLYEKKKEENLETVKLYNRILNKVHDRIKCVSRQRGSESICWYVIPEIILGVPRYNHTECVNYICDKLIDNGFRVQYIKPNLICICWAHYVPNYVRNEIRKKTGLRIDNNGKPIIDIDDDLENPPSSSNIKKPTVRFNLKKNRTDQFVETNEYKPTGKMVYNNSIINSLDEKLQKKP